MPRRARPASRRAPAAGVSRAEPKRPNVSRASPEESDSDEQDSENENSESEDETGNVSDAFNEERQDQEDGDAFRVAQWVDEEDLDDLAEEDTSEEEEGEDAEEPPEDAHTMKSIRNDLSSLPFGTLRKAQQKLIEVQALSDTESDSDDDEGPETIAGPSRRETEERQAPQASTKRERPKRSSKHAPTEISSTRPVTRRRTVVEVKKLEARDPRFLPLAGEFDSLRFHQQYGFLSEMHETELKTLRADLKRARKLLVSSPRDIRTERAREVDRLERALKRAESSVNKDKREHVEQAALERVRHEEKEKQKQGKRAWYMKSSDKKDLLMKARYEALASSGGSLAVKKAIEKKQRKISQKEKKSRPFPSRRAEGDNPGNKRHQALGSREQQGGRPAKRQRV
ncbi:DUF947-domain-containing protein [Heliocybe sulcata]|uniref:rRNA biogenesis protein RRP36 n=1 Tax=Heliocybe sulcata TaxID=5364 RepID=A0A5C3NIP1_9AGAM|nr:DUF947-domain-containing protein [Heliocybe sulcata]